MERKERSCGKWKTSIMPCNNSDVSGSYLTSWSCPVIPLWYFLLALTLNLSTEQTVRFEPARCRPQCLLYSPRQFYTISISVWMSAPECVTGRKIPGKPHCCWKELPTNSILFGLGRVWNLKGRRSREQRRVSLVTWRCGNPGKSPYLDRTIKAECFRIPRTSGDFRSSLRGSGHTSHGCHTTPLERVHTLWKLSYGKPHSHIASPFPIIGWKTCVIKILIMLIN